MQLTSAFVSTLAAQKRHEVAPEVNTNSFKASLLKLAPENSLRASVAQNGKLSSTSLKAVGNDLISPDMVAFGKVGLSLIFAFGVSARALTIADKLKTAIDAKDSDSAESAVSKDDIPDIEASPDAKASQEGSSTEEVDAPDSEPNQNAFDGKELKKLAIDVATAYVIVQCMTLVGNEFNALQQLNTPMEQMIRQADALDQIPALGDILNSGPKGLN